jgi:hypothetical protein
MFIFSTFVFWELYLKWKAKSQSLSGLAVNILTIVFITFSFWFIHFRFFLDSLNKVTSALMGQFDTRTVLEYQTNIIMTSNASIWLVIDHFIKLYGPTCLYFSISLFFILYIIHQYYQNDKLCREDTIYSLQFCVAICIGIALITGYFVIFEPVRTVTYGLIFATILCGLFFYRIWHSIISEKRKFGLIISMTVIITIVCMLAMLTIYPSPWISSPSPALTYGDKNGIDWTLEYQNADIPIVKDDESIGKYLSYYYESKNVENFPIITEYTQNIPSDFGYNTNRSIGDSLVYLPDKNVYMITTELMKLTPDAVPVDRRYLVKTFTDSDFIRLKNDPTANLIYSGNKFGVWNINVR